MRSTPTHRWKTDKIECFVLEPELVTPAYVQWLNDPVVNRFLESRFATHGIDDTRDFVAKQLADPGTLFLGVRSLELGRHVGNVKMSPINRTHGLGEIGIMIGDREAWGRGIGTDALNVIADIARDEIGLRKLTAGCYASNAGSVSAFRKAGFTIEGVRPRHFILDGKPEDFVLMARHLREVAS